MCDAVAHEADQRTHERPHGCDQKDKSVRVVAPLKRGRGRGFEGGMYSARMRAVYSAWPTCGSEPLARIAACSATVTETRKGQEAKT